MKTLVTLLGLMLSCGICAMAQTMSRTDIIDVWSIGNAHYPPEGIFTSYDGINYSAATFLKHLPWSRGEQPLLSTINHRLTKNEILKIIDQRIDLVLRSDDRSHTIILYYCGHGVADLSGSTYWVPGNIETAPADTTFEFLTQKLLNVDEIVQRILVAQEKYPGRSRFIILSDCCSNRVSLKWYNGVIFHFKDYKEGTVTYDSTFLKNKDSLNSALRATAELTFNDLGRKDTVAKLKNKPTINEFAFIPEMIRNQTFMKNGNLLYYSSKMGEETAMVDDPDPKQLDYQIGPIARRAMIYFKRPGLHSLDGMLSFLVGPYDKGVTSPVLVNRTRD